MHLARAISRASTQKRLWLAAAAWAVFLSTVVIGNQFLPPDKAVTRTMIGHDFLAFYGAGTLVHQGRSHELYDLDSIRAVEQSTGRAAGLEIGDSFGPWWNPPFYALVFAPLAALPYAKALVIWRWIGLTAAAGAVAILCTFLPKRPRFAETFGFAHQTPPRPELTNSDASRKDAKTPRKTGRREFDNSSFASLRLCATRFLGISRATAGPKALLALLVLTSMPFVQTFSHGQNTFTSLLILSATVALWRAGRNTTAGVVGGLLFYKPQLGAVVAVAMTIDLGVTAAAGLAFTAGVLAVVNTVALPGTLGDWLARLPENVRYMQIDHDYLWERHATLKAFWRLLIQGRRAGQPYLVTTILTDLSLLAIGGYLLKTLWTHRHSRGVGRDRVIAATVVTMPLLMPFYFDYDLLLLSVSACLYGADPYRSKRLTLCWCALFAWFFVNPAVALHTHVGGTVLLLTGLSIESLRHAHRPAHTAANDSALELDPPVRRAA